MGDFENSMAMWGFADVEARVCKPYLRTTILSGGAADCFDGTNSRVLDAGRAIQPLIHTIPAPGLLGMVQPLLKMVTPHYIQLELHAGQKHVFQIQRGQDKPLWEHLYKKGELTTAIERFLQGATPTTLVRLWRAQ
jgi:hypothetical protein